MSAVVLKEIFFFLIALSLLLKIFYNDNFHVRLKEIVKFEVEILCCSSMSSIIQLKFFYLKKSLIKIKPVVYNGSSEKKKKICFS